MYGQAEKANHSARTSAMTSRSRKPEKVGNFVKLSAILLEQSNPWIPTYTSTRTNLSLSPSVFDLFFIMSAVPYDTVKKTNKEIICQWKQSQKTEIWSRLLTIKAKMRVPWKRIFNRLVISPTAFTVKHVVPVNGPQRRVAAWNRQLTCCEESFMWRTAKWAILLKIEVRNIIINENCYMTLISTRRRTHSPYQEHELFTKHILW